MYVYLTVYIISHKFQKDYFLKRFFWNLLKTKEH